MKDAGQDKLLTFFHGNRDELHGFLLKRLHNSADTEDLLQELFIRIERYNGEEEIMNAGSFVYRIANNLAIDRLRHKKRMMKHYAEGDERYGEIASPQPGAEQLVYDRTRLRFLQEALSELSGKQRKCFLLHRCDNMTYKEVGVVVGLSESMVKKHVTMALAHCRKYMRRKEG